MELAEHDIKTSLLFPTSLTLPKNIRLRQKFHNLQMHFCCSLRTGVPCDSNKGISIILDVMWKPMKKEEEDVYMSLTREVNAEHKRKYPEYVYNPNEAHVRKALW
jgi:hypothetical protein